MACYIYTDPNCDPCMVMTGERGKAPNPTEIGMEIIGTRNAPLYPPKPNKKGNNLCNLQKNSRKFLRSEKSRFFDLNRAQKKL